MLFAGFFFLLNVGIHGAACAESLEKESKIPCSMFRQTEDFSHVCFYNFLLLLEQCIWNESRDLCHASLEPCGPPAVEVDMFLVLPE